MDKLSIEILKYLKDRETKPGELISFDDICQHLGLSYVDAEPIAYRLKQGGYVHIYETLGSKALNSLGLDTLGERFLRSKGFV